jgi:hypothetical protein
VSPPNAILTAAAIQDVAAKLREDKTLTFMFACMQAGHSRIYNTLKQAVWRVRHDKASDVEVEMLAPLFEALAWQQKELTSDGMVNETMGHGTTMARFLLERLHRYDFGDNKTVAVTNADGDDLFAKMPADRLLETFLAAKKIAEDG